MKQLILLLLVISFLLSATTHAQREYWGVTTTGGNTFHFDTINGIKEGMGNIFKTDKHGHNVQSIHSFDSATGFDRQYTLTQAKNGKLYGILSQIGTFNDTTIGVIYELDVVNNVYKIVHQFTIPLSGYYANPGRLLSASNGKLYGICITGNNVNTYTTLFSFDPNTYVFTNLYKFVDVGSFTQEMMQASNGKVYITFQIGPSVGYSGIIYEYNIQTNTTTQLYKFADIRGSMPYGAPVEWTPGVFYGCFTNGSGTIPGLNKGGIYEFNVNTNTYTMKARMDTINGNNPYCDLVRVGNKLYGTTLNGGSAFDFGILFEYDPATSVLKNVHAYDAQTYYPDPYLQNNSYFDQYGQSVSLMAQDSLLFGLTSRTIFSFNPYTQQFTTLEPMTAWKGRDAVGSLIMTCTKPYYKTPTQDTVNVPIGFPFTYNIHSPNSTGFQWIKAGTNITDVDSILNFNPFNYSDTGSYSCRLSNECGDTITIAIYLIARILPVNLLSFKATLQNQQTLLKWTTAQEANNRHFIVERSRTGNNFIPIGKVNGHGTTTQPNNYQYTDENTPEGISYYRLQQVDYDGKSSYSSVEMVNKTSKESFTITPNPANSKVQITFTKNEPTAKLEWINANGQIVQTKEYKNIRQQNITINRLPSGVYTLRITTKNGVENRQLVVER